MKIGFIGAGKVGFSLGKLFTGGGIHVTGYYSQHIESAKEAATFTHTRAYDSIEKILADSDALILTVPDGKITEVYYELKAQNIIDKIICHCSGAVSAREAFPGISEAGAYGYSIHPLFPVSSKLACYTELADAFFCLDGEGPHLEQIKRSIEKLGPKVQIIPADEKVRYHAACVMASNLVCALVDESLDLMEQAGFTRDDAMKALSPLIMSNTKHIVEDGPVLALTGPMERGDISTINDHLHCFESDEEKEMYRLISKRLLKTAVKKNPDRNYGDIDKLLADK